jgi:heptosyltransferase-2
VSVNPQSALLISVQGIGNTVLMTPVITSLADGGYEVDTIVSDNGSNEIVALTGNVRKQYVWIEHDGVIRNLIRLGSELRHARYDEAYALYPNGKRENVLLSLARASRKTRYSAREHSYRLLDFLPPIRKVPFKRGHDVNSNLRLAGITGSDTSRRTHLGVTSEAREFANQFFESSGLREKFVVAVHPGGGGLAKRWSEDKYVDLCLRLAQDQSIRLLVFGSASEEPLVHSITESLNDRAVSVCGLSIDKVTALLAKSSLLIGNDSALAHIASAMEVPLVAVWGYTDFYRAAPVNPKGLLLRIDYPCNPCYEFATGYIDDCRYHLKCIRNISAERVYSIVKRYIALLTNCETAKPEAFASEPGVTKLERLESGCLMIDLQAPA